ncbi:STXB protein, partial [Polyodon spathula]|nr:STXB protein [Polyodon spathula]
MASVGNETLEMAALGRPFQLGMLYDCRKDSLIPGITLWDLKELTSGTLKRSQPKTEFSVTCSDSIGDKASTLKVDISLKASLLGGMVEVGGAAKYFSDFKKSTKQSRVTLQYYTTTRYEQLTMTHLGKGNVSYPSVFEDNTATHVVTAVLYGAQAYFVFDRELASEEKQQEIQGEMKLAINNIFNCMKYKLNFMNQLSTMLPAIRGGGQEEESLIALLKNYEDSPFNAKALNMWLANKEREVTVVNSFLQQLRDIKVVSSTNELDQEVLDHTNKNVVCFTFTSLDEPETYLLELENYLKTPLSQNPQSFKCHDSKLWVSTETVQKMRMTLKVFLELVNTNRENEKTKFFIASKKDQQFPGACILLFENGSFESTYFKAPLIPDVPEVCRCFHFYPCLSFPLSAPVTLDPNTAHPDLILSEDRTSVRRSKESQQLPDSPERFDTCACVLGSEGFTSGKRCWDVEVESSTDWILGVTEESSQRKGEFTPDSEEGYWIIGLGDGDQYWALTSPWTRLTVEKKPQKIRVQLDCDGGEVAFFDPSDMRKPIYTFKHRFTERMFPVFFPGSAPISVCPVKAVIKVD